MGFGTRAVVLVLVFQGVHLVGCSRGYGARLEAQVDELIESEPLMQTVRFLASDELEGRLAGQAGHERAALAMAERMADLGLQPGTGEGYLHHFAVETNAVQQSPELEMTGDPGRTFQHGGDFLVRGFTGAGDLEAPLAFVGYGLAVPGWDEYEGVDVEGRVVLALKQPPGWSPEGVEWGETHLPRPKARTAAERGAVGLLLVSAPHAEWQQPPIGSVLHGPGEQLLGFPQMQISLEAADALLAASGVTITQLQERIDEGKAPSSFEVPVSVRVKVSAEYVADQDTVNVVGILPGRRDGHVIVGAHLDHVGRQGDVLFPGANDNASGVAVVMAVAEAFVRSGMRPERSVVFVLFSAEEQGTLGAEAYVADPALALDGAVAMINVDCAAVGQELKVGGGGASPKLHALARDIDGRTTQAAVEDTWYGGGADAQAFFDVGIPTLYVANVDGYAHLHQPTDRPETLDLDLLLAAARLVFLTTAAVADGRYEGREPRQPPEET